MFKQPKLTSLCVSAGNPTVLSVWAAEVAGNFVGSGWYAWPAMPSDSDEIDKVKDVSVFLFTRLPQAERQFSPPQTPTTPRRRGFAFVPWRRGFPGERGWARRVLRVLERPVRLFLDG